MKYKKWEPVEGISGYVDSRAIHDDIEGIRFIFKEEKDGGKMIRLSFDEGLIGYRVFDEGDRAKIQK